MTESTQATDYIGLLDAALAPREALAFAGASGHYSYADLHAEVEAWRARLRTELPRPGEVVAFPADYELPVIGLLLALWYEGHVAVPLPPNAPEMSAFLADSRATCLVPAPAPATTGSKAVIERLADLPADAMLTGLREAGRAGLIVFSSGTSGTAKAALFDFSVLCGRYDPPRPALRTLAFLFVDHMGGINTLLQALTGGGALIAAPSRTPLEVGQMIERFRVEVLPATPTFLRMMLLEGVHERCDLSSLRVISYGTEPMPTGTLTEVRRLFPAVRLKQTYGLSELGVLPTRTPDPGSLWLQLGGRGCETRVVDGILHIRSQTPMLGYLNAPSPFDVHGWYNTQDLVETRGEYIRFLGRETDTINVGGNKVRPVEVEEVLLSLPNVADATVEGRANPITGEVVCARLMLREPEDHRELQNRVVQACRERLEPHKVPALIEVSSQTFLGHRLKKLRGRSTAGPQASDAVGRAQRASATR